MNNKGMVSLWSVFVMMMVVIVLVMAQQGIDTNTIDSTINSLNWNKIGANVSHSIQNVATDKPEYIKIIINIIDKAVDFFGYTILAIAKLAMQLAKDNPDIINWRVLFALIILSLIAPLIYPVFIITVSLILIIKEWWMLRKEKKELKKWSNKR